MRSSGSRPLRSRRAARERRLGKAGALLVLALGLGACAPGILLGEEPPAQERAPDAGAARPDLHAAEASAREASPHEASASAPDARGDARAHDLTPKPAPDTLPGGSVCGTFKPSGVKASALGYKYIWYKTCVLNRCPLCGTTGALVYGRKGMEWMGDLC